MSQHHCSTLTIICGYHIRANIVLQFKRQLFQSDITIIYGIPLWKNWICSMHEGVHTTWVDTEFTEDSTLWWSSPWSLHIICKGKIGHLQCNSLNILCSSRGRHWCKVVNSTISVAALATRNWSGRLQFPIHSKKRNAHNY